MMLTFIDKDSYEALSAALNKFVKKVYCNNKVVAVINTISISYDLGEYLTIDIGWGIDKNGDEGWWKSTEISFNKEISLESLISRFEQCIINSEEE